MYYYTIVMYLVWEAAGVRLFSLIPSPGTHYTPQYSICITTPLCIGHLLTIFQRVKCNCKDLLFTENCLLRAILAARLVKKARKVAFTLGKKHRNIERKNGRLVINAPGVFFMIECFITFV
jgi:hypothetical protein